MLIMYFSMALVTALVLGLTILVINTIEEIKNIDISEERKDD